MTNTDALLAWIQNRGYKLKFVASTLGITYAGFKKKLDNQSEFKLSEIGIFMTELGMSKRDRDIIFFSMM